MADYPTHDYDVLVIGAGGHHQASARVVAPKRRACGKVNRP